MGLASAALVVLALGVGGPWERHTTAHYAPGLMERVAAKRGLPSSRCYIASPTIPIGTRVQVKGLNTGKTLLCYVADTSARQDRARHIRAGLIEVGYDEAEALCGSTKLRNDECVTLVRVLWLN